MALALGPSCTPAAPSASDVCSGWRPCTRRSQPSQHPTCTRNRVTTGSHFDSSHTHWSCTPPAIIRPPQSGHAGGNGASSSRSARSGSDQPDRFPYAFPPCRPVSSDPASGRLSRTVPSNASQPAAPLRAASSTARPGQPTPRSARPVPPTSPPARRSVQCRYQPQHRSTRNRAESGGPGKHVLIDELHSRHSWPNIYPNLPRACRSHISRCPSDS